MRVAAIYDIHGNLPALEAVLQDIRRARVDQIVVGGDVFPGPMAREALDLLLGLEMPVQFIQGNGDRWCLLKCEVMSQARSRSSLEKVCVGTQRNSVLHTNN